MTVLRLFWLLCLVAVLFGQRSRAEIFLSLYFDGVGGVHFQVGEGIDDTLPNIAGEGYGYRLNNTGVRLTGLYAFGRNVAGIDGHLSVQRSLLSLDDYQSNDDLFSPEDELYVWFESILGRLEFGLNDGVEDVLRVDGRMHGRSATIIEEPGFDELIRAQLYRERYKLFQPAPQGIIAGSGGPWSESFSTLSPVMSDLFFTTRNHLKLSYSTPVWLGMRVGVSLSQIDTLENRTEKQGELVAAAPADPRPRAQYFSTAASMRIVQNRLAFGVSFIDEYTFGPDFDPDSDIFYNTSVHAGVTYRNKYYALGGGFGVNLINEQVRTAFHVTVGANIIESLYTSFTLAQDQGYFAIDYRFTPFATAFLEGGLDLNSNISEVLLGLRMTLGTINARIGM